MINELQNSLEHLRFFIPPAGIMVVGAGNGSGIRAMLGWNLDNVALIEADAAQIERMERAFALPQAWRVINTVIGTSDDETPFYRASNPAHNGTLNPESLRAIWPNLCANDTEIVLPTRIDALVSDNGLSGINWLLIECFPVIDIARSAEKFLEGCEVVVVRTLDDTRAEGTLSGNSEIVEWFGTRGFRLARRIDTDHPSVYNFLFVRDFQQQTTALCSELQCRLSEAEATAQELSKNKQALEVNVNDLKDQLNGAKLERDTARTERDSARTERDALKLKVESLTKENANFIEKQKILEEKITLLTDSKIENLVNECMGAEDIFEVLDKYLLEEIFPDNKKFELICSVAENVGTTIDRMRGVGLLNQARLFMSSDSLVASRQYERLSHLATMLNQLDLSVDFFIDAASTQNNSNYNKKIADGYSRIRSVSQKAQQHGHDLLIDYISKNVPKNGIKEKLLIEIGTTRENVPGQGSTEQLAKLCKEKNIRFITVDMDPHNTRWANFVSQKKNLGFEAVTSKGEDYLKDEADDFDFIFLDAYDFEHGQHSELRQTRYEKNLGSKIDETECHIMHLKCAYSVEKKLKPGGVVCIDDTWKDEHGNWTAKGALAVPYLLSVGFRIIEARNKAVLMNRTAPVG